MAVACDSSHVLAGLQSRVAEDGNTGGTWGHQKRNIFPRGDRDKGQRSASKEDFIQLSIQVVKQKKEKQKNKKNQQQPVLESGPAAVAGKLNPFTRGGGMRL